MAARTSAGVGVGVTITLLGVISLTLFVLTIVFLSKYQAAQQDLRRDRQDFDAFVTKAEQNRDDIRRLREVAQKQRPSKSLVAYLADSMKESMSRVTGSASDGMDQFAAKLDRIEGAKSNSLLGVLRDRDAEIERLKTSLTQADKDRTTALANLAAETERTKQINDSHQKTVAAMNADIDRYKSEVEQYRAAVNQAKLDMDQRVGQIQQRAEADKATLNDTINRLQRDGLIKDETIAKLRGQAKTQILKPDDEYALVDGRIVGVDPGNNQVFIGLGERDKVMIGLRFIVYAAGTLIRPDPNTGEYPRGKAEIEVIRVGSDSSICRITGESAGNPVVKGDLIANAIYDPKKVYKFMVYGNFDANGDGRTTAQEAEDVKAVITAWGGQVVDDLVGDVDFLVLGARPTLPPPPASGAPIEVVREYQRLDSIARRYDDLFAQASSTSIPVLNENRLYTLSGRRAGLTAR
jgi:hypothetical protein